MRATRDRDRVDADMHDRAFELRMLILYTRDDCQLCDHALALLASARAPDFESVWIDDDASLEARYGERVPVLRNDQTGAELDWPFDGDGIAAFLRR